MTKNPWINGLSASLYIFLIVKIMTFGSQFEGHQNSFLVPVVMISLFTLSAAVMGYLFCFQPIQLYFDNKKKQAVDLFLQTVGVFGTITFVILGILFSGVVRK